MRVVRVREGEVGREERYGACETRKRVLVDERAGEVGNVMEHDCDKSGPPALPTH